MGFNSIHNKKKLDALLCWFSLLSFITCYIVIENYGWKVFRVIVWTPLGSWRQKLFIVLSVCYSIKGFLEGNLDGVGDKLVVNSMQKFRE